MPKRARIDRMRYFPLAGVLTQGGRIERPKLRVSLPARLIASHEVVFRFKGESLPNLNIADGDLLIAEPRRRLRMATAQCVIATVGDRAFVGRWWTKHGKRELQDGTGETIADVPQLKILAAVTLIIRLRDQS